MTQELTTPVSRIVWGHPGKMRPVIDLNTKQPKTNADGTPQTECSFGLAIPKADTIRAQYAGRADVEQLVQTMSFDGAIWPKMHAEALTGYPNGAPNKFSWKYQDGDGLDSEGKPFNQRDGYAGHFILTITSRLGPVPMFKLNGGKYDQLPAEAVKCGDYVAVGLEMKLNIPQDRTHTPSLYINPRGLEFVGYGTEIVSAGHVDPSALFGGQERMLPAGASATPTAPTGGPGMPLAPPAPGPGTMPPPPGPGAPVAPPPPPAPVAPPPPPPPVAAPPAMARPTDPTHISNAGTAQEMWWNGQTWIVPPAPDFVNNAGMPGTPPPR